MDSKLISFFRKTSWLKHNSFTRFLLYAVLIITSLATSLDVLAKNKSKAAINIGTCTELQNMNANLSGQYGLTNDIDCSGINFSPIGNSVAPFTGSLDGAGHKIINLSIQSPDSYYVGLFGYVSGDSSISNLTIQNVQVLGKSLVGALVGDAEGTGITISNVEAQGKVISNNGGSEIGGLVGRLQDPNSGIKDSSASVIVEATKPAPDNLGGLNSVGGLVGALCSSTITHSHATGTVTVVNSDQNQYGGAGGLVGEAGCGCSGAPGCKITDSYATGAVIGFQRVGGLVGAQQAATISTSYATGKVSGTSMVGGLVGDGDTITYSYATGAVNGSSDVGGLIGNSGGQVAVNYSVGYVSGNTNVGGLIGSWVGNPVTSNYWDTQTSGQSTSAGGAGVIGKTTAEMYQQSTYNSYWWNFTTVWNINEGKSYPWLRSTSQLPEKRLAQVFVESHR